MKKNRPLSHWAATAALGLAGLTLLVFPGCSTSRNNLASVPSIPASPDLLRIGITPNLPPMVFEEGGEYQGIEVDLARRLGAHLDRRVRFVEVPWEQQINALLADKTDIIMSSMTITTPRQIRVSFSLPYMQSGQAALIRRDDLGKLKLFLFNDPLEVGVQEGTTGDYFVQQYLHNADRVPLANARLGARQVARKKIDLFIHDAPVVWWWASQYEKEGLTVLPAQLTQEELAWAVRKKDERLLEQVNAFLAEAAADGSLQAVINRWLPQFTNP